jgi:toxin ParE1/3/4
MIVRFTSRATAELDAIFAYIAKDNPRAAARVINRIEYLADSLSQFPDKGVVLRRRGVRKLVATPYPYLILYRVLRSRSEVQILEVVHGARRRSF